MVSRGLPYSVSSREQEDFVEEYRYVREFLGKLSGRTRRHYAYDLCRFFKWLRVMKGLDLSPEAFLNEHSSGVKTRAFIRKIVFQHSEKLTIFAR